MAYGVLPVKTHDLGFLLGVCEKALNCSVGNDIKQRCLRLDNYSVKTRYPNNFQIGESETAMAVSDMKKVSAWVNEQFKALVKKEYSDQKRKKNSINHGNIER